MSWYEIIGWPMFLAGMLMAIAGVLLVFHR